MKGCYGSPDIMICTFLEKALRWSQASARERLGLASEAKIVCAVSVLIPEKSIQCLIDATALLVKEYGWLYEIYRL